MAKKKKTTPPGLPDMMNLDNATTAALIQNIINMNSGRTPKKWTKKELENIFTFKDPNGLTDTQIKLMVAGAIFLQNDITPDIYKTLYEIASKNEALKILPIDAIFGIATGNDNPFFEGDYEEDDDDYDDDYSAPGFPRSASRCDTWASLANPSPMPTRNPYC